MVKSFAACAVVLLLLLGGCARLPDTGVTTLKVETLSKLHRHLLESKADVDQFRARGPFEVQVREDHELALSPTERIEADLYLSEHKEAAPLVILLHGSGNSKEDHAYQALHLASWGMHSLVLQLPSEGPWIRNGRTLARVVNLIRRHAEAVDKRVDPNRIVLAGHSFGGAAVTIALADDAAAVGGILLDPAGIGKAMPGYLRRVHKPVIMIASDLRVNVMRQRGDFYEFIPGNVVEISIKDAHHDDAMFPLETRLFASDSQATEELQITFVSALTAAAFSLAFTGKLDYAWESFGDARKSGKMFDALRK